MIKKISLVLYLMDKHDFIELTSNGSYIFKTKEDINITISIIEKNLICIIKPEYSMEYIIF